MSIHIDDLREAAANRGLGFCDDVADELEDLEKAYALLFAGNAKLRNAAEHLEAFLASEIECEVFERYISPALIKLRAPNAGAQATAQEK